MSGVDFRSGSSALEAPKAVSSASEVASHWRATGSALANNVQAVQNASIPTEQWSGQTAQAVVTEIQTMGTKVSSLSGKFPEPAGVLETWRGEVDTAISEVKTLQEEWDSELSNYYDRVAQIEADAASDPDYDREAALERARQEMISKQSDLKSSYDKKITALSTAASEAAKTINGIADSVVPRDAVKAGRSAVGAAIFGSDTPIVDSTAEWQYAQELAPKIADALKKEPMTAAYVRLFNEKYGEHLSNPYVAAAVAERVSIDDINKASIAAYATGFDNNGLITNSSFEDFNKNLGALMVMATGGSNLSEKTVDAQASFDLMSEHLIGKDGATVSQIFDTKLNELKESGRTTYTHPGTDLRPEKKLFGYDIFAQLAGYAASENPSLTLSANFYDKPSIGSSVFTDIVKFDHDAQGYKTRLGMGVIPEAYQLCGCDPTLPADKALQRFDPVQAVLELSDTPDGLDEKSAPILHQSEENRLGVLRRVLDSNIDFDPVESVEKVGKPYDKDAEPMSMVRYLVAWRGGAQFGDRAFYDQGEALGDVLADASRPGTEILLPDPLDYEGGKDSDSYKEALQQHKIWKEDALHRASIAANTMAAYQEGLDRDNSVWGMGDKIKGEDVFGRNSAHLRSWMGSIISPYVSDLAAAMNNNSEAGMSVGSDEGAHGAVSAIFNRDMVERFSGKGGLFEDLAFDQPKVIDEGDPNNPLDDQYESGRIPALKAVQISAFTNYMDEVANVLHDPNYGSRSGMVNRVTDKWTELIQETFDADADRDSAVARDLDKTNKDTRKIVDFIVEKVAKYAGKQLPGDEDLTKAIIKSAAGKAEDVVWPTDHETKVWASERDDANKSAHELMQHGLTRVLYESPYWTERVGTVDVSPGSESLARKGLPFVNEDGTLEPYDSLTKEQRAAVNRYFMGTESDFHDVLQHQFETQQDANQHGQVPQPLPKKS